MKIRLRLKYADGDAAATLLQPWPLGFAFVVLLYPFFIKTEVQLINVQLKVNDRRAQVAMLQLAIMNHILIMLDDEVQARRRRRAKWFWVRPCLSADRRLQFGHYYMYDQLIRAIRMEDISSCFNCMRMEQLMFNVILNRVGPRIQKSDTNFSRAFERGLKLVGTPDVLIPY